MLLGDDKGWLLVEAKSLYRELLLKKGIRDGKNKTNIAHLLMRTKTIFAPINQPILKVGIWFVSFGENSMTE